MVIEITPLDTLFFRDGKPFSMGEDTWADGIFPPPPSVIYGALRTLYFANHVDEFKEFVNSHGQNDPTKKMEIKGIYLKDTKTDILLFPIPLDIVKQKKKENKLIYLGLKNNNGNSHIPTPQILMPNLERTNIESLENCVIDELFFNNYLLKKDGYNYTLLKESKIFLEPKIGIRKSHATNSSEEGALYRTGMHRLKDLSIIVVFENLEGIQEKGLIKLGGEGKAASYKKIDNFSLLPGYRPVIKERKFKLYLATPAIFNNGWIPGNIEEYEEDIIVIKLKGIRLKLLAAAIGKHITVGGFDMKIKKNGRTGWPKEMVRAVPAGSVYYFEVQDDVNAEELINTFHNKTISDVKDNEGFGLAFMGVI